MDTTIELSELKPNKIKIFIKQEGLKTIITFIIALIGSYIGFVMTSSFTRDQGMQDRVNRLSVEKSDIKYVDRQDEIQRRLIDQNRIETYNTFQELRGYIQEQNKENTRLIIEAIKTRR